MHWSGHWCGDGIDAEAVWYSIAEELIGAWKVLAIVLLVLGGYGLLGWHIARRTEGSGRCVLRLWCVLRGQVELRALHGGCRKEITVKMQVVTHS
jgi:hypothetical protein